MTPDRILHVIPRMDGPVRIWICQFCGQPLKGDDLDHKPDCPDFGQ